MSIPVFQIVPLSKQSFFQRLFKQHPEENAVIELNNLFAAKPIRQIGKDEITTIEEKYGVSLSHEFPLNLEEFYATYLSYCLEGKMLTADELTDLKHIKGILSIEEKAIANLHIGIGSRVYKKSYEKAVEDGRLTESETALLNKLETDLQLPKKLVDKISTETRTAFVQNYVSKIIANQRLSPEEEQELSIISKSLNVNLEFNEQTEHLLQKSKTYWALENSPLLEVQIDISLQKSERCYFTMNSVKWYELRSVRQRVGYSGYSTSFKIAKGFYLRSGSYTPQSYSTEQMTLIDTGVLYLTDKRIIFTGAKKNSIIKLDKILRLTPYTNGVEIGKDTGKLPTLQLPVKADEFCIMLDRLIYEK